MCNNDGDVSIGEQQMGLGLDWDSLLGLVDQFNLCVNCDVVIDCWCYFDSQSLFYSLFWGWWIFIYGYSQSDYCMCNEVSGFFFKFDGDSCSYQFCVECVLYCDGVSKIVMSLGFSYQCINNYVEDICLEDQSMWIIEIQFGFNYGWWIGSGFVNFDFGWQQGIGVFGVQGCGYLYVGDLNVCYDKYSLIFSYLQLFQ